MTAWQPPGRGTSSQRPGRRRALARRAILLLGLVLVIGWGIWRSRGPGDPAAGPTGNGPAGGDTGGLPAAGVAEACEGWPARVALDPVLLERFSSEGWLALAAGRPDRAIDAFQRASEVDGDSRLGLLRARVEWARALWQAHRVMLAAQRHFLEARLLALPEVAGRELYPFLRAAVALQAGEAVEIEPWLAQVPASSPLAPAVEVLRTASRDPVSPAQPEADALRRWRRHFARYAEALRRVGCPYPGAAASRAGILEAWSRRETLPPPDRWPGALETDLPDFDLGRCEGEAAQLRADLYDSSPWTQLAGLVLEAAIGSGEGDRYSRYFQMQVRVLWDPREARAEACRLLEGWGAGGDEMGMAALVFGDLPDERAMRGEVERICQGAKETCGEDGEVFRARLADGLERTERCYRTIEAAHGPAGAFARQYQLYGGILSKSILSPVLNGHCLPGPAEEALRLWEGQRLAGTRWQSLEATLARARVEASQGRFQEGVAALSALAGSVPLFVPVFEAARRAGGVMSAPPAETLLEN